MKGIRMVVAATLAPLLVVAAKPQVTSGPDGKEQTVKCEAAKEPVKVTVSVPDSTVVVQCQPESQFDPTVTGIATTQTVWENAECNKPKKLDAVCPGASIVALENKNQATIISSKKENHAPETSGATLAIDTLPVAKQVFFVRCKPQAKEREVAEECVVEVTVNQATNDQAGATGQAGKVQVCAQPGGSIILSLPNKDSSVQFKCLQEFSLYPTEPKRVFKDDCKTEENLRDMTRTQATSGVGTPAREVSAASSTTYTLRADKKPPGKKLCYLCAKQLATDKVAKPAKDYCAIYVESGARTKFSIVLAPRALLPPCVVAVLPFL